MTALVVVAHPDDETLGAGGTIARWTAAGRPVSLLVLGPGTASRPGAGAAEAEARVARCEEAARLLGVVGIEVLDLPDQRYETVDLLDVVRLVEERVDRIRPDTVVTHHGGDLNADHRRTHQAVLTATRPVPGSSVRTVLACEVPSSTEWAFTPAAAFAPNVFHDVTATIDRKLAALACYADEVRPHPHPRSPEAVRALATVRGATAGVVAAEAFALVRATR